MQKKYIIVGLLFFVIELNISCSTVKPLQPQVLPAMQFEEYLQPKYGFCDQDYMSYMTPLRYMTIPVEGSDDNQFYFQDTGLESYDFCVIGINHPITSTSFPRVQFRDGQKQDIYMSGMIEIKSIIFGDPEVKEYAYAITQTKIWKGSKGTTKNYLPWGMDPTADLVVFGKKDNGIARPVFAMPVGRDYDNCTKLAEEICRLWCKFRLYGVNKADLQNARLTFINRVREIEKNEEDKKVLVTFFGYHNFFDYLFQLTLNNEGMDSALAFLQSIPLEEMPHLNNTLQQWAEHLLECYNQDQYFTDNQKFQLKQYSPNHARTLEMAGKLTREQRQMLKFINERDTRELIDRIDRAKGKKVTF